ncbi:hypothetical protein FOZ60_003189 [Perkinsus olseni]|uniref:Uncharacterized protein n=1 Tax=Perkinsus olseni TaxID=32597 RepID=A0A7J6NW42_PEROL|nr:hypothetical protein FOZ60_003189 [Perkinsus olseni]
MVSTYLGRGAITLRPLLEGDEETTMYGTNICVVIMNEAKMTLRGDGSGIVEEGAGSADYSLKQLRSDIALYQRALSRGDKDARFEFRTLQWIGAHAVMKKETSKLLSCYNRDVKFRWKAYQKIHGSEIGRGSERSPGEYAGTKPSAALKGVFVSLIYRIKKRDDGYEDKYFTVRVPEHPRSCEHALELGLEHLYERTEPVKRVWISNAFSRLTPIEVEDRLKKVAEESIANRTFQPVGDLGKPMSEIAFDSNLSQSCFGYDDSMRLSWRLENIRVFPGPFVNKRGNDSDAALVVDFHDSKDIPPFAVYTKAGELHVNGSISCLDAMETFAMRDFVKKMMARGGVPNLRKSTRGLVHETLQVVGQNADLVKEQQPSKVSSLKAQRLMVCKSDDSDFMWTVEEPKLKNKKRVKTKSTSVEIGIGSDRSDGPAETALLVSRSEYPDLTSCHTALKAAGERFYQKFDMRAITRSELVSDISRYLAAIKEAEELKKKKDKLKIQPNSLSLFMR